MDQLQNLLPHIGKILLGGGGLLGFFFALATLSVRRKLHLFDVYREVMNMMDSQEIYADRRYVYSLSETAYEEGNWLALNPDDLESAEALRQRTRVDRVLKAFDHLGLLVREGQVPVDIIARFYVRPALDVWARTGRYISSKRVHKPEREHRGYLWEFENLVFNVIIPGVESEKTPWDGVKDHDDLEELMRHLKTTFGNMPRDHKYAPRQRLWAIAKWWEFWRW